MKHKSDLKSRKKLRMATAVISFVFLLLITAGVLSACSPEPSGVAKPISTPDGSIYDKDGSVVGSDNKDSNSGNTAETVKQKDQTETTYEEKSPEEVSQNIPENSKVSDSAVTRVNGQLKVHYIDVGQADSILIQQGKQNMLIDAGNNGDGSLVVNYLKKQGVTKLDYVVATHPHEDHIGGMDTVIKNFKIGNIYMPKATANTQTFRDVISAMSSKGLKASVPVPGSTFKLGDAVLTILAPVGSNYEDTNNYSIVLKLTYGSNKFLFQGDAEDVSETEIIDKGFNISADVLKVGHHGSDSSSTQAYLNRIKPKYAVISVGKDNTYGHPKASILSRLDNMGVKVYRTDLSGSIIATSDGTSIKFNASPTTPASSSSGNGVNDASPSGSDSKASTEPAPSKPAAPSPSVSVTAKVDDPTPAQNSTIDIIVTGPAGGSVETLLHYKSKDTPYSAAIGSDGKAVIPVRIGRASKGYKVDIDVTVTYDGKTYTSTTSFTPQ